MKKIISLLIIAFVLISNSHAQIDHDNIGQNRLWGCKTVNPFEACTYRYGEYPTNTKSIYEGMHKKVTWKIKNGKAMDSNGKYTLNTITTDQEEVIVEDLLTFSTVQIRWESGPGAHLDVYNEAGTLIHYGDINILDIENPIQNITLSDNRTYNAPYLNINDVKILTSANITFNGYNSVIIKSPFVAQAGSKVRIYNQWPTATAYVSYNTSNPTKICNVENEESILYQNVPNPFKENTEISYYVPDNYSSSFILIHNMFGELVKKVKIEKSGKNHLLINGYEFIPGIYTYSLIIDNKIVDSKRFYFAK